MSEHRFKVNLKGIMDILSKHLYSSPQVFLRELLQNCVDALTARQQLDSDFTPEIHVEWIAGKNKHVNPTLVFEDNGIGLTKKEIHQFLSTIGHSSKPSDIIEQRSSFIGQFGIGMLSCLMVCDEIVVLTRSIKKKSSVIKWCGRGDGSYSVSVLKNSDLQCGTRVYLRCNKDGLPFFQSDFIKEKLFFYGGLLPFAIFFVSEDEKHKINTVPPWKKNFSNELAQKDALLEFGERHLHSQFFDCIPLKIEKPKVQGAAYLTLKGPVQTNKNSHYVYIKNMLISASYSKLLPDWAFFVKCIINSDQLTPDAARESIYEDFHLEEVRNAIADSLRDYIKRLAKHNPQQLQQLIQLHYMGLKAVASEDENLFHLIIDFLPFQTSLGEMTFAEYKRKSNCVYYAPNIDDFRQISQIAASQSMTVINACYAYDMELIGNIERLFPDIQVEHVQINNLVEQLQTLSLKERDKIIPFLTQADKVLNKLKCRAEIKKFKPATIPVLFSISSEALFMRKLKNVRREADELFGGILGSLETQDYELPELCFNFNNSMIKNITKITDNKLLRRIVETLYVQSLLLGHHPLTATELKLLSSSLWELIELTSRK